VENLCTDKLDETKPSKLTELFIATIDVDRFNPELRVIQRGDMARAEADVDAAGIGVAEIGDHTISLGT
jgi:hypothetical protein